MMSEALSLSVASEEDDARVREIKGDAPRMRTTGEGTNMTIRF